MTIRTGRSRSAPDFGSSIATIATSGGAGRTDVDAQRSRIALGRVDAARRGVFGSRPADGVFEIVGADEQLLDDNPRERSEIPGVGHFVRLRAPIPDERLEWFEVGV